MPISTLDDDDLDWLELDDENEDRSEFQHYVDQAWNNWDEDDPFWFDDSEEE